MKMAEHHGNTEDNANELNLLKALEKSVCKLEMDDNKANETKQKQESFKKMLEKQLDEIANENDGVQRNCKAQGGL